VHNQVAVVTKPTLGRRPREFRLEDEFARMEGKGQESIRLLNRPQVMAPMPVCQLLLSAVFVLVAVTLCRGQDHLDPFGPSSKIKVATEGKTAEESIRLLKQLLADGSCWEGSEAAHKLLEIVADDSKSLFDESLRGLKSTDARRRREAAVSLGRLCLAADLRLRRSEAFRQATVALAVTLGDPDPSVRAAAASGLAEAFNRFAADSGSIKERLRVSLGDDHAPVRAAVLKDKNEWVVTQAIRGLGEVFQSAGPVRFHCCRGARCYVDHNDTSPDKINDFERYYHFSRRADDEPREVDRLTQEVAKKLARILSWMN